MSGKSHHVVPDPKGGWNVKRSGAEKATLHTDIKQDAIDRGREISRNQGTEFYIHGKNGKFSRRTVTVMIPGISKDRGQPDE